MTGVPPGRSRGPRKGDGPRPGRRPPYRCRARRGGLRQPGQRVDGADRRRPPDRATERIRRCRDSSDDRQVRTRLTAPPPRCRGVASIANRAPRTRPMTGSARPRDAGRPSSRRASPPAPRDSPHRFRSPGHQQSRRVAVQHWSSLVLQPPHQEPGWHSRRRPGATAWLELVPRVTIPPSRSRSTRSHLRAVPERPRDDHRVGRRARPRSTRGPPGVRERVEGQASRPAAPAASLRSGPGRTRPRQARRCGLDHARGPPGGRRARPSPPHDVCPTAGDDPALGPHSGPQSARPLRAGPLAADPRGVPAGTTQPAGAAAHRRLVDPHLEELLRRASAEPVARPPPTPLAPRWRP
jgi:hypothetical protein